MKMRVPEAFGEEKKPSRQVQHKLDISAGDPGAPPRSSMNSFASGI